MRGLLQPGDSLLLGTDLEKPVPVLLDAYDDPIGVTAAFNLNLLGRINRELDGHFDLSKFDHDARFNKCRGASKCICDRTGGNGSRSKKRICR